MVEGSMNIIFKAAKYFDLQHNSTDKKDNINETLLEMIIPVVKTIHQRLAFIQLTMGLFWGYGFCSDFILQYYRDIRISSIYEGTTGIQSQDLLGRK